LTGAPKTPIGLIHGPFLIGGNPSLENKIPTPAGKGLIPLQGVFRRGGFFLSSFPQMEKA